MTGTEVPRAVIEHLSGPKSPDARRIEALGVPVVETLWPRVLWIACVAISDMSSTVAPTDDEARMIRSYIEFAVKRTYNETYVRRLLDAPLAAVAGHNTVIFVKHPETPPKGWTFAGWGYRRESWRTGSWPHAYQGRGTGNVPGHPLSLVEALDHLCSFGSKPDPKWEAWKSERPEVFGG